MGRHGQNNFLGVNYQAWAALALLLQHLRNPEFKSIHLEAPKLQDFDLIFTTGQKIICEAKGWKSAFGAASLKKVFKDLKKRGVALQENESVLIISISASLDLRRLLKRVKDISPNLYAQAVRGSGFTKKDVPNLQKVSIWEIGQKDCSDIASALLLELIDGWVPPEVLSQMVKELLVDKIYHGSAESLEIQASEFREVLKSEAKRLRDNVGASNQPSIERLKEIKKAAKDPKHHLWAPANLSAVSGHIGEFLFASDLLKQESHLVLNDWSRVLDALVSLRTAHRAFELIKSHLTNSANIKFAVEFLESESRKSKPFFNFDFRDSELMSLAIAIFEKDPSFGPQILEALQVLVRNFGSPKLFVKTRDRLTYFRQQAGKVANQLYVSGSPKLKAAVVEFILSSFSLVEDEGDYWHKAPPGAFETIKNFLCSDVKGFEKKFREVCEHFANQFSEIYKVKFKLPFKGFELIGGMSTWAGNDFNVKDRFFIRDILSPALDYYFASSPAKAYKFIKQHCVFSDAKVSRSRPDFLRRCCIPLLVKIYSGNLLGKGAAALDDLELLIRSRKGIPSKHHLAYQLLDRIESEQLQWTLIVISIDMTPGPLNPFIEKAVCRLSVSGHSEAFEVLKKWLANSETWTDAIFGGGPLRLLSAMANVNPEGALDQFIQIADGDFFNRKVRDFDVYEWSDFLVGFFDKFPKKVKSVLKDLSSKSTLTDSQQVLVIASLARMGKDERLPETLKIELYDEVIKPLLQDPKFLQKIPISHIREQLTEVIEGLMKGDPSEEGVRCAVEMVEVLAKDPSPELGSARDEKLEQTDSDMFSIESVRGKVAWALQHFFRAPSRKCMPRIRAVLDSLLKDESNYIRAMACYPFSILLGNRYTFTSADLKVPLLADTNIGAIDEAALIEKQAVDFISNNLNRAKGLTKSLPKLFHRLRLVGFEVAKELWALAEAGGVDLQKEVLPLLLFYAHFRAQAVSGNTAKANPLLDGIKKSPFDYDYFAKILEALTVHESEELRASLSWHYMKICDVNEEPTAVKNVPIALRYFKLLARRYNQNVFRSIYMFINEHRGEFFDDCVALWFTLVDAEQKGIVQALKDGAPLHDVQWWPFCFNHDVLLEIYARQKLSLFLDGIETLLNYPADVVVGLDKSISKALAQVTIEPKRVKELFERWVEKDFSVFKDKEEWEKI